MLPAFLQRLQHAGHLLPATLTGCLVLKALDLSPPGSCARCGPSRYSMPELLSDARHLNLPER